MNTHRNPVTAADAFNTEADLHVWPLTFTLCGAAVLNACLITQAPS